jgi:hypothetical protein
MGQLIIEVPQKLNHKFSIEDAALAAEVLRQIEEILVDAEDIRDARAALAEPGENISLEDLKAELGI